MNSLVIIMLTLMAVWLTLKAVRGACYVLSLLLPGGHQAYAFWFVRPKKPRDENRPPNVFLRVMHRMWRAWCAVWSYLLTKQP